MTVPLITFHIGTCACIREQKALVSFPIIDNTDPVPTNQTAIGSQNSSWFRWPTTMVELLRMILLLSCASWYHARAENATRFIGSFPQIVPDSAYPLMNPDDFASIHSDLLVSLPGGTRTPLIDPFRSGSVDPRSLFLPTPPCIGDRLAVSPVSIAHPGKTINPRGLARKNETVEDVRCASYLSAFPLLALHRAGAPTCFCCLV